MNQMRNVRTILDRFLERYGKPPIKDMEAASHRAWRSMLAGEMPRLEEPSGMRNSKPARSSWIVRWPAVATLVAAITLAAVLVPARVLRSAPAVLEDGAGLRNVQYGELVRSSGSGTLKFSDGARVEMRAESEVSFEGTGDDMRVRVRSGDVIVNATRRSTGQLSVETKDISAVGKVLLVNTKDEGTRVAVIVGEARVQQGATQTRLLPGEHVATSPKMELLSVKKEGGWSPQAEVQMALLQTAVAQKSQDTRLAFEEVSIRLATGPVQPGQRGGAVNVNIGGCSGGAAVELDPRRMAMSYKNIYTVIALAYFTGAGDMARCQYANRLGLLTGGPSWIQTDGYDIQAVIPEGTFTSRPTLNDPKLLKMMQTMLEERFKIALSRQMKEMSVYVMTLKEPSKYAAATGPVWLTEPRANWTYMENQIGLVAQEGTWIYGANATMADLSILLGRLMGQPIIDRTGFTGRFHFSLNIFRDGPPLTSPLGGPRNPIEIKSLITEFEKAGVKLELTKEKVEVLNIDRIDRPSEN